MINLIPPEAKKSITIEYWVRVGSVWALLLAFALACASFVFLPAYVLISSQVDAYTESTDSASEKIASYENVTTGLIRASQEARTVIAGTNITPISEYVALIDTVQGSGINITKVSLSRADEGIAPIQVSGVATDRQSLAAFRDRLLREATFSAVDLPIANLAKDRDIPFSITITVDNSMTP